MQKRILKTVFRMSRDALLGVLICCCFAPLVMAESSSAQSIEEVFVRFSAENNSVEDIFSDIEETTSFSFLYSKSRIETISRRITFAAERRSVADVMRVISRKTGLRFRQINSTITVKTTGVLARTAAVESQVQIQGTVYDAATKETLPGVNILVKGTSTGTSTGGDGTFELSVPSLQDTLVVSFIGYQTREVPISGQTELAITLAPQAIMGDEMVVVGYGEREISSLTSAVSDIGSDVIGKKTVFDSRRSLQGVAPGVTVIDRGGDPAANDNIQIRIRGNTTIGNNDPLILVDGIEGNFEDLDPNSIASISVLKDASATAIYGSRGANGVILVTTKGPSTGDLKVEYNGYYGMQQLNYKPEHMGLEAYMRLQNEAYSNRPGGQPLYTEEEIREYVNADDRFQYPLPNTMWDATFSPAPQQTQSLQFSGGSETLSSLLLLSYSTQDGIIPNFGGDKYRLRLNTDFKVNDRIRLNGKLVYRKNNSVRPFEQGAVYWRLWHSTQWTVPQYPDGTYGVSNQGHNPYMYAKESGTRKYYQDYLSGNFKADVDLLDNLTYTLQVGGQIDLRSHRNFKLAYEIHDYYDPATILKTVSPNRLTEYRDRVDRLEIRNLLNYQLDAEAHAIDFLAGFEQIQEDHERLTADREGFLNNELPNLNAGSTENWSNSGWETDARLRSVFGRLHYAYDDRYIVEANARYDGSSKFYGSNNQYSFFPSFSAAWRISNEAFWEPVKQLVSDLKLRGSWGKTGNNSVDLYSFFPGLSNGSYSFGGQLVNTYYQESLSNRDLTWETTTQANVGVDVEFWEGMAGLSFDFYKKRTDGILLTLPIPETVGLNAAPQNAGVVDNTGWELTLSHNNAVSEDFNYSISANLSNVQNEVIDLAGTGPYISGEMDNISANGTVFVTREGEEINALYGYKALGYFESEQEIQNHPTIVDKDATYPGDLKYADLNEDGIINGQDRTVIGSTVPHYTFGITSRFNYKNFDLGFFIQGVGQADAIPVGAAREGGNWEGFTLEIAGDYWTPENTDARFPRREKRSRKNQSYHSSWWVIDASYLKLKNFDIGYTIPPAFLQKIGINIRSLRLYASGTNLITLSEATDWGLDPEFPSGRLNYYPQTKLYSVGVNLKF